jgi:hypothetical protein
MEAVMGDFDESIAWLKERVVVAREDLRDFEAGRRQSRDGVDITDTLVARLRNDIERYEIMIAAYEAHNA